MNRKKSAFSIIELGIVLAIIGVIISAIVGSSYLIAVANLVNLRSISSQSPIYDIPDNTLWLDVANKKSFPNSSSITNATQFPYPGDKDSVEFWSDVSPNLEDNIVLSEGTPANQPLFTLDSIDGLPLLRFDGVDDILTSTAVNGYNVISPKQGTLIVVQKYRSGDSVTFSWNDGDSSNRLIVDARNNDGDIYFDFGGPGGTGKVNVTAPSDFDNEWKIVTLVRKTNDTGVIRVNGIELVIVSNTMTDAIDVTASASYVVGNLANVDVREIILFKRELNSDEISDIENYLSNKWQIDID